MVNIETIQDFHGEYGFWLHDSCWKKLMTKQLFSLVEFMILTETEPEVNIVIAVDVHDNNLAKSCLELIWARLTAVSEREHKTQVMQARLLKVVSTPFFDLVEW